MEFSRHRHCSGLPFPSPGDLPNPGIEPASPALSGEYFTTEPHGKEALCHFLTYLNSEYPATNVSLSTKNMIDSKRHLCIYDALIKESFSSMNGVR